MTGHEPIVAMRRRGWKPRDIVVIDGPAPAKLTDDTTVFVGADTPEISDLRFAVGLTVHLLADDMVRGVRWAERLQADGARLVVQNSGGVIALWRS